MYSLSMATAKIFTVANGIRAIEVSLCGESFTIDSNFGINLCSEEKDGGDEPARRLPKSHTFMGLDAVGKVRGLSWRRWGMAMSLSWQVDFGYLSMVYFFSPFIAHDLATSQSYWRLIDLGNYEFCGLSIRQWSVRIQEELVLLFTVKLKIKGMSSILLLRLRGPEAFNYYTKEFIFGWSIVPKTGDDLVEGGFLEIAQWGKDECG
ncbi:predicted protein [Arabidopsis lyrata subsp. lyrata]|uniref:Predicted protein n=1 Tax=Arabidopsis lyrata subsp. lyrata TaxID=81972 RepID=D7MKE2_ARALL|nr:predicted protein [Arabidopsis lyrata subsp. lyrata]